MALEFSSEEGVQLCVCACVYKGGREGEPVALLLRTYTIRNIVGGERVRELCEEARQPGAWLLNKEEVWVAGKKKI